MFGRVYIFDLGEKIKIGASSNVPSRYSVINKKLHDSRITRIYTTINHINFFSNEKILHDFFNEYRIKGTEYFTISFEKALIKMPKLHCKRFNDKYINEYKIQKFEKLTSYSRKDLSKRLLAYGTETIAKNINVGKVTLDTFLENGTIPFYVFVCMTELFRDIEGRTQGLDVTHQIERVNKVIAQQYKKNDEIYAFSNHIIYNKIISV